MITSFFPHSPFLFLFSDQITTKILLIIIISPYSYIVFTIYYFHLFIHLSHFIFPLNFLFLPSKSLFHTICWYIALSLQVQAEVINLVLSATCSPHPLTLWKGRATPQTTNELFWQRQTEGQRVKEAAKRMEGLGSSSPSSAAGQSFCHGWNTVYGALETLCCTTHTCTLNAHAHMHACTHVNNKMYSLLYVITTLYCCAL